MQLLVVHGFVCYSCCSSIAFVGKLSWRAHTPMRKAMHACVPRSTYIRALPFRCILRARLGRGIGPLLSSMHICAIERGGERAERYPTGRVKGDRAG